jgi:predicted transcriptional regulator with HTH domain
VTVRSEGTTFFKEEDVAGEDKNSARTTELLEKSLVIQMYALGIRQTEIARMVGKSPNWVNALLKGLPRRDKQL